VEEDQNKLIYDTIKSAKVEVEKINVMAKTDFGIRLKTRPDPQA
jgi:hypothetical protein